jgi:hypothetical protein
MSETITTAIVTVASGVVSGGGVAWINHIINRKKTQVEIQKLQAEVEKTRAETEKIHAEVKGVSAAVYSLGGSPEEILLDGSKHLDGFDIKGNEGTLWTGGDNNRPVGEKARGEVRFEDGGILNIQRKNTEGRYELWFQRYDYKGREHSVIPKDELVSGMRKLRVSGEAKAIDATHELRFVVRRPGVGGIIDDARISVESNEWTNFRIFLQADPTQDCVLRIDDQAVSSAPSSVQIRNIVLARRT